MQTLYLRAFVLCALAACGTGSPPSERPASSAEQAAPSPDTPAVRIGKDVITLGEVDAEIAGRIRQIRVDSDKQIYEARRGAVEMLIAERLFGAKAKAEGKDLEAYIRDQVEKGLTPATDEEVQEFFEENQAKMGGAPLEQVKPQIQNHLDNTKRQEIYNEMMDKARAAAKVEVVLEEPEPPRVEVAAVGPGRGPENAPVTIIEFSDFQ